MRIHCVIILIISLFGVFKTHDCNFQVNLKQILEKTGFHRNITYQVVLSAESKDGWFYEDCIVGIDQTLPKGVFVNTDEIEELSRNKKLNAVLSNNRIDIESPTELSEPFNVFVIGAVTANKQYLWFPVHARYHKAVSKGGYARNEIGPPRLYLRCPDQRLDRCGLPLRTFQCYGSSKRKCAWRQINFTKLTDALIWEVPVGNTDHYYVVASLTAVLMIVGALYLLNAIHEYKIKFRKKKQ